ncbi:MAG TPA: glycoside hydrolase family 38 C-terminal domain-containing protein [Rhodothermales bacterium]|nr:glycoside hydrolase family 38 C-terminal domain-containing protein [Rhodothermales bacterium]
MARYHLIPHSHWDREWYLTFDEFRAMLVHMIDDLLEIIDRDPNYRSFLLDGQTSVVDDYLEVRPDRRDRLATLVREGRLFVGPWYVLPDSFLVSGESLIRNLLIGRSTAESLGGSDFTGYIPDSFGHTAQIPQLLRGFGIDTAVAWRGFGGEPGQEPSEYRWMSPDGSWVLMEHLHAGGYSEAYFPETGEADVLSRFDAVRKKVDYRASTPARLLLSGGDHHWPTASLPEVIETLNEYLGPDSEAVHSNLPAFFADLKSSLDFDELPVVEGEMRFGYRWAYNVTGGVYSARMYIKQANARCQRLLERVLEPMNALAVIRGGESQHALLRQAWKTLLQNHPHDSICGCSIDPVHREMMTRFQKVENLGRAFQRFGWLALADDPEGISADDKTIVVFNTTSVPRDDMVECDVDFYKQDVVVGLNPDVVVAPAKPPVEGFRIEDAEGNTVPFEVLSRSDHYSISHTRYNYPSQFLSERFRVRLQARDVPPLGFKALRIVRQDGLQESPESTLQVGGHHIQNEFLRVACDEHGHVTVTELATGASFGPLAVLEDGGDAGDEYNYSPPRHDAILRSDGRPHRVETRRSALSAELHVSGAFDVPERFVEDGHGRSDEMVLLPFKTTVTLYPGSRLVRFRTELDNQARDHRLRMLFDTGCVTNTHFAENAFAVVKREQKQYDAKDFSIEVPAAVSSMQRFVNVEDVGRAATVIADGLPEYELVYNSGGVVALTLLRCIGNLSRNDLILRPGGKSGWHNETPDAQCLGTHVFEYAFLPHRGPWEDDAAEILTEAARFTEPLLVKMLKADDLSLDGVFLAGITPAALTISAAKEAEDGSGIVIRVSNPTSLTVEGELKLGWKPEAGFAARIDETLLGSIELSNHTVVKDSWGPFEIKTFVFR